MPGAVDGKAVAYSGKKSLDFVNTAVHDCTLHTQMSAALLRMTGSEEF